MEQKEWYDNKELYEMFQQLKADMADLSKEMAETRTLIRDYNGLRQKVEDVNSKINTFMWLMPATATGMSLLFTFLNYIRR
ncbi:hypothetical protein PQV03_10115 [Thermoanaerobacterium thermosaccharolyticum]|uniref:hypothetical protein n=1 Tax=Thermoanaerobacterium thermosaccharolyticum TaxID=1517 RepID=UPI003D277358